MIGIDAAITVVDISDADQIVSETPSSINSRYQRHSLI